MSLGKAVPEYGSNLVSGPLGVVQVGFTGWDLGKTNADTELSPDADMKDIMYQQDGTKGSDHTVTGADYVLKATFAEIKTKLLSVLAPYFFDTQGSVGADSGVFKADMYTSLRDTIAGVLKVQAVINQSPSDDVEDTMYFYEVIPLIDGSLIQWGADTQRNFPVSFKIKAHYISASESTAYGGTSVHGYFGDPANEDLPAADYPDLDAPYVTDAAVNSATELELTLSEDATAVSGVTQTERFIADVDGVFVAPTAVAYVDAVVTLTFAAGTFTSGATVALSGSADTFEDGEDTPNQNDAFSEYSVTNEL